jgi:CRISPR-associated endonuclease/helicase Cas3
MMTFPTFTEFFAAVADREPYRWQQDLADHLQEHGRWPWHVDVPTGLGKTSCIDIAVYELARQAHHGQHRTAPQRIFHVVDRRTIIDSTVEHARWLAQRITDATSGPLSAIREALSELRGAGTDEVVHVAGVHGQDADDLQWMQRVTGLTIVSLTSHQFVSRLLLRGYGVSPGTRPLAAALCAIDRLVLFDEPHLSTQAVHTIVAAERLQGRAEEDLGLPRSTTVLLGATVPAHLRTIDSTALRIRADQESDAARERLQARRPTTVDWLAGNGDRALCQALTSATCHMVESGAKRTVVFVNTVGMAQEVHRALAGALDPSTTPVRLVTSRFRPWDKAEKTEIEQPGVVVTTQTLEVGVDVTFDALVTELCPWPSLLQRLGRFNRHGECNGDKDFARRAAVVVAGWDAQNDVDAPSLRKAAVSVYGADPLDACARLLRDLSSRSKAGVIDLSPAGIERLGVAGEAGKALDSPQPRLGTLTSAMLPLMAQTRPTPEADLPVAALISGPDAAAADDVDVAWRDELDVFDLPSVSPSVSPQEIVTVPRNAWTAFLSGGASLAADDTADVESTGEPRTTGLYVPDLTSYRVWDQTKEAWAIPSSARQLARSSRVIVKSELEGYTPTLGWTGTPSSSADHPTRPTLDISQEAALADIGRLRFGQRTDVVIRREQVLAVAQADSSEEVARLLNAFEETQDELSSGVPEDEVDTAAIVKAAPDYVQWLISASAEEPAQQPRSTTEAPEVVIRILPESSAEVVIARVRLMPPPDRRAIALDLHQAQVGAWAGTDAETLGLDKELIASVASAGVRHDAGKSGEADFYQRYLRGGDPSGLEPVAKSARPSATTAVDRAQLAEAGVPLGWRHEAESVRSVPTTSALVRHLVGSHHGWFRPVMPPTAYAADSNGYPQPVEHADDFARLNDRFGVWGLAYLETLVRMADWRASASPWKTDEVEPPAPETAPEVAPANTSAAASASRRTHAFEGLHSHPMTGWFSSVGLLAAATTTDPEARLHWEQLRADPTGTPLVPVLTTSEEPRTLVHRILESPSWQSALDLADDRLPRTRSLGAKFQKVGPTSMLHELLSTAEGRREWLLLGLLNDLAPGDSAGNVPLAIAPFANMASYVKVATDRVDAGDGLPDGLVAETVAALTTVAAGFSAAKCDGGMDRSLGQAPGVNGLGDPVTRQSRTALAPLALYGMASLGAGPLRGMGVVAAGEVLLPLPTVGQTFAQLRALTYLGRGRPAWRWTSTGLEWIYAAQRERPTDKEAVWVGQARRRG